MACALRLHHPRQMSRFHKAVQQTSRPHTTRGGYSAWMTTANALATETSAAFTPHNAVFAAPTPPVPEPDRAAVQSLTVDELRRLHEGVLARYELRPSEFAAWKARAGG